MRDDREALEGKLVGKELRNGWLLFCCFIVVLTCMLRIPIRQINKSVLDFLFYGIFAFLALLLLKTFAMSSFKTSKIHFGKRFLWTLAILLLSWIGIFVWNAILFAIEPSLMDSSNNQAVTTGIKSGISGLEFLSTVFFAPIIEELLFRGVIFRSLRGKSFWMAHLFTAFFFGFYHVYDYILLDGDWLQLFSMITYVIFGFGLSFTYEKTKNITFCILLHAIQNTLGFFVAFL